MTKKKTLPNVDKLNKGYSRGIISLDIKRMRVDDSRPKLWTTLDTDKSVSIHTDYELRTKKKLEELTNKARVYQLRSRTIQTEIDSMTDRLRRTKLNYLKYEDKTKLREIKDSLKHVRELMSKQLHRKNPNQDTVERLQKRINSLTKYIERERKYRTEQERYRVELNRLKSEQRKVDKYTPEYVVSERERLTAKLEAARLSSSANTTSPYVPGQLEVVMATYKRLNLHFHYSKEDMYEFFKKVDKNFWNTHSLDQYWRDYKHRDELIASGQYETYRALKYKENYLKALNQEGLKGSPLIGIISANLNRLTDQQILELFGSRNGDTTSPDNYRMPTLSFVYQIVGITNRPTSIEDYSLLSSIRDAFKSIGLTFDEKIYEDPEAIYRDIAKKKYKGRAADIEFEDFVDVIQVMDMLRSDIKRPMTGVNTEAFDRAALTGYNLLKYEERVKYSPRELDSYAKRNIILTAMRKLGVRYNKNGEAYVPFFRKDLVAQFLGDLIDEE